MNKVIFAVWLLVACGGVQAQGTFRFTWHGQSNYFQASFALTDAEMQPGATFSSKEFTNSLSVDSLSGISYHVNDGNTLFDGGVNPWSFEFVFVDSDHETELFVHSLSFPPGAMAGTITEQAMSGQQIGFEPGYWTYTSAPEPSMASFVVAAVSVSVALRRKRGGLVATPVT